MSQLYMITELGNSVADGRQVQGHYGDCGKGTGEKSYEERVFFNNSALSALKERFER